jgi:sugar O-acyltransferase (sialic acid O-acetyltransferase NeuD family)
MKYCILGAGGFGREAYCCLLDMLAAQNRNGEEVCFMVNDELVVEKKILGIDVIPLSSFDPSLYKVVVAIGDPEARKKAVQSLPLNTVYTTIIHPSVVMSKWVEIGEGSIITAGTILTCNIKIGRHVHLNLHTTVGHDCHIGDYVTTAPAANISGKCSIGDCTYLGTNSSLRQGINICGNVTIGMGAVVVKDITEEGTYVGNPIRKLEKK